MYLPVAATKAERMANGDPRLSLTERYPDHAHYVAEVTTAANLLRDQGFLLQEDVDRYVEAAQARHVP